MKFNARFECEGKTRAEYDHDYSDAIDALSRDAGPVAPIGEPYTILDTYFDTPEGLLQRRDHRLRIRCRPDRRTLYNYKAPIERDAFLVVCREVTARVQGAALDLGNPFHRRLPVLSPLMAFLDEATGGRAQEAIPTFAPRLTLITNRTSYAIMGREGGPALFALIDRTQCARWGASRLEPSERFSELEAELPVRNLCPSSLEFLRGRLRRIAHLGYLPTHDSKYAHACELLFQSKPECAGAAHVYSSSI